MKISISNVFLENAIYTQSEEDTRRARALPRGRKKKGKGRSASEETLIYRKKVVDINVDEIRIDNESDTDTTQPTPILQARFFNIILHQFLRQFFPKILRF